MKNLLIIEDNYIMRLFLINYFNAEFHVEAVEKPSQAKSLLEQGVYDLVIVDNQKPNTRDHEDLKAILKMLKWQNVPNILLTDSEKSAERIHALEIGANDTLSKPFNPVELRLRIKSKTGLLDLAKRKVA